VRFGARPTNVIEWLAMKAGKVPAPILDVLIGPLQARALIAAQSCGAFRELAKESMTAADLAKRLNVDAECLTLVLRVVRAMGYVDLEAGKWALSRDGRRWFSPDAKESLGAFVEYGPPQWNMIARMDEVLRTGRGTDFH